MSQGVEPRFTNVDGVPRIVESLRGAYSSGLTQGLAHRKTQLGQLVTALTQSQERILGALQGDFKSRTDALMEYAFMLREVTFIRDHFEAWASDTGGKVRVPWMNYLNGDRVHTMSEPYGLVLVVGVWNYPFSIVFEGVAGALAAGNVVLLKPSEVTPRCAVLIQELVEASLDARAIRVVQGGAHEMEWILDQIRFDYIFFTGGTEIGRAVYQKAARHLTPVTLELGGKSPAIILDDADLETTMRRLLYGKLMNAGQLCIAPDYILTTNAVADRLLPVIRTVLAEFYPHGTRVSSQAAAAARGSPESDVSNDYSRIVNDRHTRRLCRLIEENRDAIVYQECAVDEIARFVPPVVFDRLPPTSSLLASEIFGPLLPIVRVDSLSDMLAHVRSPAHGRPLVVYLFTGDRAATERVLHETSSGSLCVNDTLWPFLINTLPFGGVGESGLGHPYHGKFTFDMFTHKRAVVLKAAGMEAFNRWLRYPPSSPSKWAWLSKFMGFKAL